jgi:hypothetical protein
MINELPVLVKAVRVEDTIYLTRDMSIVSPDLRSELVLRNFNRLHEVSLPAGASRISGKVQIRPPHLREDESCQRVPHT